MSNSAKVVKRGEMIFKEGDKISSIIVLQSGSSNLCLARPKKNIDLFPVGSSQILGEQALIGANTHSFSLMATSEVKYMEIPVDLVKTQVESSPQFLKLLIKSLAEQL